MAIEAGPGRQDGAECLVKAFSAAGASPQERRHGALIEWATAALGLDRALAESVYALAEEENLEPWYALQLIHCGVGVVDFEDVDEVEDTTVQSLPPGWEETRVRLDDIDLEKRLRLSFRRLRGLLESYGDAGDAAEAFVASPDVGVLPQS